jgi:hypothetical protein
MTALEVQRTLVKSPPELWAELSNVATLARLLDERFGEIEITRANPEKSLAWASADASGTVELAASGWGTKVRLTVRLEPSIEREQAAAALTGVLDEIGTARHRPFSRP